MQTTTATTTTATLSGPGTYGNRDRLKTAGWTWNAATKSWSYEWSRILTREEVQQSVWIWTDSRKGRLDLTVTHS